MLEALIEFDEHNEDIIPEKMDLDTIYEDDCLIAINKPPDMVVHPSVRHFTGTVANGLMHHLLSNGKRTLIRPVSRLDRDTSGIIVFALNPHVQNDLVRQMRCNSYQKEYLGIVHGAFPGSSGTIDLPIERLPSIMLRHVSADGAPSVTHYEVIERYAGCSLLKFRLVTGRTHQIRVHCQASGHPLVGDTLYSLPEYENKFAELIQSNAPFINGLLLPPLFRLTSDTEGIFAGRFPPHSGNIEKISTPDLLYMPTMVLYSILYSSEGK